MSTRGRKGRGRPPKTPSLSSRQNFYKKAKLGAGSESDSRCSTPASSVSGTPASVSLRPRAPRHRESAQKSRSFIQKVVYDDDSDDLGLEGEHGEVPDSAESDSDSSVSGIDHDQSDEELDDSASVWSESSFSTVGSFRKKYSPRYLPRRSPTPELIDEKDIPPLELPKSSQDLILPNEHVMQALTIYEVLRHFRTNVRLSPFRFEDFCAALCSEEQTNILCEIHIALLRALLREEDANNTTFGPHDLKDSVNIILYFADSMTCYESIRAYLEGDKSLEFRATISSLEKGDYCSLPLKDRLQVLQTLTDLFLSTSVVREELMTEGNIKYDDHCRSCHKYVSFRFEYSG